MRHFYVFLLLFTLSLLPSAAKAERAADNYFAHIECTPDKNELILKTYVSPNEASARPRDDIAYDQWAPKEMMFACPFDNGDVAYFETRYGGDESPYRSIHAFINRQRVNDPLVFANDRAAEMRLTSPYGHPAVERSNDFAFKSYSESDLDAMTADALKKDESEEHILHEENERLASRRDPGAYGWGAQYKDLRKVADNDAPTEWGKDVQESADGSMGGVYNWGVIYKNYKERDPMYGSGPWGWGPATIRTENSAP